MESLRTTALQRELTRIENEAREHSMAAIGVADTLAAAEQLCVLINTGLESNKGVAPTVIYYDTSTPSVVIYTHGRVVEVLQRSDEAALEWTNDGGWAGSESYKRLAFSGFEGVQVIVEANALAHYLAGRIIEQAAA